MRGIAKLVKGTCELSQMLQTCHKLQQECHSNLLVQSTTHLHHNVN
jgi:hypothetical protein